MININVDDVYKLERFRKRLFWSPQHTLYKVCNFESDYNTVGGFALEKLGGMPAPAINLILPI